MKTPVYHVNTVANSDKSLWDWNKQDDDLNNYPIFRIGYWREEGVVGPETCGRVIYIPHRGLDIAMWCYEDHPRAIFYNPNDPVHTDSCMEAFINIFPETPEYGYISVEMNHNGASLCSFGTGRYTRQYVLKRGLPHPEIQVTDFINDKKQAWCVHTLLQERLLESLYNRSINLQKGHKMKANFYKCGDYTENPSWGSWSQIYKLEFHAPDTFGDLIIE